MMTSIQYDEMLASNKTEHKNKKDSAIGTTTSSSSVISSTTSSSTSASTISNVKCEPIRVWSPDGRFPGELTD